VQLALDIADRARRCQPVEPMLITEPPPRRRMPGTTDWIAKKAGRWLIAMRSSQYSSVTCSRLWRSSLATLLTSAWKSPSAAAASAIAACSAATSRTSQTRHHGAAAPPAATWSASARLAASATSTNATRAPCAAKAETMPAPMPEPPPVTKTARSRRLG